MKSRSIWFILGNGNKAPFYSKTIKAIIRVKVVTVASLYEVATVEALTENNNDVNLVETQTARFAGLLNRHIVLRE